MKKIKLEGKNSSGKYTMVDDDEFAYLDQWRWHCDKQGYVTRTEYLRRLGEKEGTSRNIYMHRLINQTSKNLETDHRNENKLDNQKKNLRTATRSENASNKGLQKSNTSGVKGVYWNKKQRKYQARIKNKGKAIYLGSFLDKIEAGRVYNQAANKYHGEFAKLNCL